MAQFIWYVFTFSELLRIIRMETPCIYPGCTCDSEGTSLICSGINMQELPFHDKNETEEHPFKVISVSDNLIENLPANAMGEYTAKDINLSHNPLSGMSPRAFERLSETLETLDLSHCQLPTIHWATFRGLSLLREIRLNNNSLQDLPNGLFDHLTALATLDLSTNGLSKLHGGLFDDLNELATLNLSNNRISSIEEGTFNHLYHLSQLDLSGNKLVILQRESFLGLDTLRKLNLSSNSIEYLPNSAFVFIPRLEILDLSRNPLQAIEAGSLGENIDLTAIYLSECQLSKMTLGQHLTGIELLDVSSNLLETLAFPCGLRDLRLLNAENNPLVCDCSLSWIKSLISSAQVAGSCTTKDNAKVQLREFKLLDCPDQCLGYKKK